MCLTRLSKMTQLRFFCGLKSKNDWNIARSTTVPSYGVWNLNYFGCKNKIQIPALSTLFHSLLTTYPTLCTSLSSYSSIILTTTSPVRNGPTAYTVANMCGKPPNYTLDKFVWKEMESTKLLQQPVGLPCASIWMAESKNTATFARLCITPPQK